MFFSRFTPVLLLLLTPLGSQPAATGNDSCVRVRLDENGGLMGRIPARDQGAAGICYAHAAATIFDYWQLSRSGATEQKKDVLTHPFAVAIEVALRSPASLACPKRVEPEPPSAKQPNHYEFVFDGGHVCDAIHALAATGGCGESQLQQHLISLQKMKLDEEGAAAIRRWEKKNPGWQSSPAKRKFREDKIVPLWKESYVKSRLHSHPEADREFLELFARQQELIRRCQERENAARSHAECVTPGPTSADLDESIRSLARLSLEGLKRDTLSVCEKHKSYIPSSSCAPDCASQGASLENIQLALLGGAPKPVAISFCQSVLRSREQLAVWQKEGISVPADGIWKKHEKCGNHAAVIIGQQRHPETGKCQLVIRNSHGISCAPKEYASTSSIHCEEGKGNIVIDADLLLKNSFNLHEMSEKGSCR